MSSRAPARLRTLVVVAAVLTLLGAGACSPRGQVTTSSPQPATAAPSPAPSPTEQVTTAAPTEDPETATPGPTTAAPTAAGACPEGITLPAGVDPRACGPAPAGATALTQRDLGYTFEMPSKVAGCDVIDGILTCIYRESSWKTRDPRSGAPCTGYSISDGAPRPACPSDVAMWMEAEPDRPSYGQAVTAGSFACLVEEVGLTCWSTVSGHGMKLSRSVNLTW